MNRNYLEKINNRFDDVIVNPGSILLSDDEQDFWALLDEVSFSSKRLVEIGTARGISTTLLSDVCKEIWTFDIESYPIRYNIWKYFEIENKIYSYIVKEDGLELASIIYNFAFDAAFIDGNHIYEWIVRDIFLVQRCGKILFHDYHIESVRNAISKLIKREGGKLTVKGKYAYWTNK